MEINKNKAETHRNNCPTLLIRQLKEENKKLKERIKTLERSLAYYNKKAVIPAAVKEAQEIRKARREDKTKTRNALVRQLALVSPMTRSEIRQWNKTQHNIPLYALADILETLRRKKLIVREGMSYWHFSRKYH